MERLLSEEAAGWKDGVASGRKMGNVRMPGAKALIVDDNEVNRMVANEYLAPYQIETAQAESGSQALQLAKQAKYDLVLMDQMMPGMDGVETARRLRGIPGYEKTPVVALTADATAESRKRFEREGFAGCLIKPIRMKQLEQVLVEQLQGYLKVEEPMHLEEPSRHTDFYPELLKAYKKDVSTILKELPKAFRGGDRQGFIVLSHRLKGASGEVGADALEEQAARMEWLGKENEWAEITRHYADFEQNIRRVLKDVEEKLSNDLNTGADYAERIYRDSFDKEQVRRLRGACDGADYNEAGKILDEMAKYRYGEGDTAVLDRLRGLCDDLQYDELERAVAGLADA